MADQLTIINNRTVEAQLAVTKQLTVTVMFLQLWPQTHGTRHQHSCGESHPSNATPPATILRTLCCPPGVSQTSVVAKVAATKLRMHILAAGAECLRAAAVPLVLLLQRNSMLIRWRFAVLLSQSWKRSAVRVLPCCLVNLSACCYSTEVCMPQPESSLCV